MKTVLLNITITVILFFSFSKSKLDGQSAQDEFVINKSGGRIILAYKLFQNYLDSEHSWKNYKKIMFENCPELLAVHNKTIEWGSIDSVNFRTDVTRYKKEDWDKYMHLYDRKTLDFLYDTLICKANKTLSPIGHKPLDLCLFLPYPGCFIIPGEHKNTIYISLFINTADVPKIMVHEYAHSLHIQRRPVEPLSLRREIVSEGMAVYLTTLILNDKGVSKSIPFMPEENVGWCFKNESLLKSSISAELGDTTFDSLKKYIADGSVATPPSGFVEKTGYFAGYRIIKACIDKGIKLEELCSLSSDEIIRLSGYFNKP